MKIIFDTNIYIAASTVGGFCYYLLDSTLTPQSPYQVFISPEIVNELEQKLEILVDEKVFSETAAHRILSLAKSAAISISVKEKIRVVTRDPADNKILECALAAQADLIVTMDQDLLKLKRFRTIAIVHPKTFSFMLPVENLK